MKERYSLAFFIYTAKSDFFFRLQIFLHAGCNFLPSKKLPPFAKNDERGNIDIHKFGQEFYIIGIFWKFLYKYLKTIPVQTA